MTYVFYYTDDQLYVPAAQQLRDDLINLGLQFYGEKIPKIGDWKTCAKYRPKFLLDCLRQMNGPIVSIDVDARIYRKPEIFDDIPSDYDIAMHYLNHEALAGTMYLVNNEKTKKLMSDWQNQCGKDKRRSALILADLLHQVNVFRLPATYCKIFDIMGNVKNPVIEHFQLSRKARKL